MRTMVGAVAALATLFVSIPARGEIQVGVLGGVNVAKLHLNMEDPDLTLRAKTFFAAGVVTDVGVSRNLSVRLEPMYLQKGGKIEIRDFFGEDAFASVHFSYFEVPVLLKLSKSTGRVRPYLIVGPSVGCRVSAKTRDEVTGEEEDADEDDFGKWDFGVGAGGGLSVPLGRSTIFVEGRYTWGLLDINKTDDEITVKNRGVQVLLGVAFPIHRR